MINLLYCFDENYNVQAFISMKSFIESNETQININVIHENPSSFKKYENNLNGLKNTNLNIKKFENNNNIPLIVNDAHYSEATYYRIFLEDYLDLDIQNILYLDPDTVCINNIEAEYEDIFKKLHNDNFVLGAKTDGEKKDAPELFEKLNMKNRYFNAGVMFINLKEWRKLNITKKLQNKIFELGDNISLADQDAMNSYFDGEYLELDKEFNFYAEFKANKEILNFINKDVYFLHYVGSTKPWTAYGGIDRISNYYHKHHLQAFGNYHISSKYRKDDIFVLMKKIINLNILHIDKPLLYIFDFLRTILTTNKINIK
tara:strand:- start:289 stop:1236 length:948 start_codon:yes stop_codon:yes gene_type:complete